MPSTVISLEKGSPTDEIDKEKGATALTLAKYSGSQKLINLLHSFHAKERTIRRRRKGEAYFSVFDCDICRYLPHRKERRYKKKRNTGLHQRWKIFWHV